MLTITPQFFTHFDFQGFADPRVLTIKLYFMSLQLGFLLSANATGSDESMKYYWEPVLRFNCQAGWANHLNEQLADKHCNLEYAPSNGLY